MFKISDLYCSATDFMTMYYIRPYCRMGPYICGVLTGYILHKTKGKFKINKVHVYMDKFKVSLLSMQFQYFYWERSTNTIS